MKSIAALLAEKSLGKKNLLLIVRFKWELPISDGSAKFAKDKHLKKCIYYIQKNRVDVIYVVIQPNTDVSKKHALVYFTNKIYCAHNYFPIWRQQCRQFFTDFFN